MTAHRDFAFDPSLPEGLPTFAEALASRLGVLKSQPRREGLTLPLRPRSQDPKDEPTI